MSDREKELERKLADLEGKKVDQKQKDDEIYMLISQLQGKMAKEDEQGKHEQPKIKSQPAPSHEEIAADPLDALDALDDDEVEDKMENKLTKNLKNVLMQQLKAAQVSGANQNNVSVDVQSDEDFDGAS